MITSKNIIISLTITLLRQIKYEMFYVFIYFVYGMIRQSVPKYIYYLVIHINYNTSMISA